jgi:hypothetical protein
MTGTWERFDVWTSEIPREPLDDATRTRKQLPRTLRPVPGDDVVQHPVFDPALKPYSPAFRATDPTFADPAKGWAWRAARRRALDLVLAAIADSEWVDSLVLRGSALMSTWFGEMSESYEGAREPGDLDFVVVPDTWQIGHPDTKQMLRGIALAAQALADERGRKTGIAAEGAVVEDIWTYDRVPGRRMVLPWTAPGLPGGDVQLDFVFNEKLPEAPELLELPGGAIVQAATPELSLAWKLMWLISDRHPRGKDLYDAVLLAECCPLPYELLHEVFRLSGDWPPRNRKEILLSDVEEAAGWVEWEHFVTEYPQFAGREKQFAERLVRAVTPTFDGGSGG